MAELVAIFSFLTAGDAIHLVSTQKDIWVRWYNRENDEKSSHEKGAVETLAKKAIDGK